MTDADFREAELPLCPAEMIPDRPNQPIMLRTVPRHIGCVIKLTNWRPKIIVEGVLSFLIIENDKRFDRPTGLDKMSKIHIRARQVAYHVSTDRNQ